MQWRLKKRFFIIAWFMVGGILIYQYMFPHSLIHSTNKSKRTTMEPLTSPEPSCSSNVTNSSYWRDINRQINAVLSAAMKQDKGSGCVPPKLNPFALEMMQFMSDTVPEIDCKPKDWVKCYHDHCRLTSEVLSSYTDITCNYSKIIFNDDFNITKSSEFAVLKGNVSCHLDDTDQLSVYCTGVHKTLNIKSTYSGTVMGIRSEISKRLAEPKSKYNILIFGFDSLSHNFARRRMGHLYNSLENEFGAVILQTYNIVGDGTPSALIPIFTGLAEHELPEVRKSRQKFGSNHTVDDYPLIFKLLKSLGTAYFEDMPEIGTWQYRMVGFKDQPADHYLRPLTVFSINGTRYCHFGRPVHEIMFDLTEQVMSIDKRRKFVFTFSGDLTHDDYNMAKHADEKSLNLLRRLRDDGLFKDTFVIVMGDHGSRFGKMRASLQGKQEERMPLMSFIVPQSFKDERPNAFQNLKSNIKVLTTPFDIHSTLLDVLDLNDYRVQTKVSGTNLTRSMSLFESIPQSRSCSEAGVEPHWCVCLEWNQLSPNDTFYRRVANSFVDHVNTLTEKFRQKCMKRYLTSVDYVSRQKPNDKLLTYLKSADHDTWVGKFGQASKHMINYLVKLTVGPGVGVFEATLAYDSQADAFSVATRDISRVNSYKNEPRCIRSVRPDLNMFCYCAD